MDRDELRNEIDMLCGNISRMMVSDDIKEIGTMFYFASNRLSTIFKENIDRVCEKEDMKAFELKE